MPNPVRLLLMLVVTQILHQQLAADLFMVSVDTQSVRQYSNQGVLIGDFVSPGAGGLVAPSGLAFGPDGNLYVSDNSSSRILRYASNGSFIDVFASDPQLNGPNHLLFRGDDLFVGLWNNTGNFGGVVRLDAATGQVETAIGVGTFRRTHGMAFGPDGQLYASSFDTRRIREIDPDTGAVVREFGSSNTLGRPMGIAFDDNGDLIVNNWNGDVRLVDPTDGSLRSTLVSGLGNTQWTAFAPDGTLIIDSFNQQSLGRYEPDGTFIGNYATLGVFPDKYIFHEPVPEPTLTILLLGIVAPVICPRRI